MIEIRVDGLTPANSRELSNVPGWIVQSTYATTIVDAPGVSPEAALSLALGTVQDAMDRHRANLGGKSTEYTSLIAVRNKLKTARETQHHKVRIGFLCKDCAVTFDVDGAKQQPGTFWQAVDAKAKLYDEHRKAHGRAKLAEALAADPAEHAARTDAPSNVVDMTLARVAKTSTSIRNMRVPDGLWEDCKAIADLRHETVSAVLVAALRDYRDANRSLIGPARVAGEQELPGMDR